MADNKAVRVRFAPSPTGSPHIGNIRTALFNWLFARHHGGTFVLRVEDTDMARKVPGALEAIMDSLRWLGLDWDEGPEVGGPYEPYFQSQRLSLYKGLADQLVAEGKAYPCYCSPERLSQMRKEQEARKEPPGYDRRCRHLTAEQRAEFEAQGVTPVIRFAVPEEGTTTVLDLIRGEVSFENRVLDDVVLLKSDGYPTYHLANVIDDHFMKITHVMRAEEWIPSTPRHVLLYQAFGWQQPIFAHLPIILAPDRSKLSKRHGATEVAEYRDAGYLPEALVNYLALLGWSFDERQEIFSRDELIQKFDLDHVNPAAAIFSHDKLDWMNGYYINHILTEEEFARRSLPFLQKDGLVPAGDPDTLAEFEYVRHVLPLVKERVKRLAEVPELTEFFFRREIRHDPTELMGKIGSADATIAALRAARGVVDQAEPFDHENLEQLMRPLATNLGLKAGQLFMTLRVAVTGRTISPGLFETMEVLGKACCIERLDSAIRAISEVQSS